MRSRYNESMKYFYIFALCAVFLFPAMFASAHQPYLVDGDRQVFVSDPEISKAYYGAFNGTSTTFTIREDKPFSLFVGVSVPAELAMAKDIDTEIRFQNERIAFLAASSSDWERIYEPYGGDDYFRGPEWKSDALPGVYTIILSRPGNQGRYVLAIGEKESFALDEIVRTIGILPSLKSEFFGKPAWTAYMNRIGVYMAMFGVAGIIAFFIIGEMFRMIGNLFRRASEKPKHFHD